MGYSAKQRKVKTTVEGADALVKDLKAMEEAAADALMAAAKAGGKIALEDAKRNCPVDTGALKQSLHLTEGKATAVKATVQVDYDKSLNSAAETVPQFVFCVRPLTTPKIKTTTLSRRNCRER